MECNGEVVFCFFFWLFCLDLSHWEKRDFVYFTGMDWIVLYCIVLYCIVLYCIVLICCYIDQSTTPSCKLEYSHSTQSRRTRITKKNQRATSRATCKSGQTSQRKNTGLRTGVLHVDRWVADDESWMMMKDGWWFNRLAHPQLVSTLSQQRTKRAAEMSQEEQEDLLLKQAILKNAELLKNVMITKSLITIPSSLSSYHHLPSAFVCSIDIDVCQPITI